MSGPAGDLRITVQLVSHPRFAVDGHDLKTRLSVTPSEAALGTSVPIDGLQGQIELKIPAGVRSGQVLRLRGQGLNRGAGVRGDLMVEVRVVVPETLTDRERELYRQLAEASEFAPVRCEAPR